MLVKMIVPIKRLSAEFSFFSGSEAEAGVRENEHLIADLCWDACKLGVVGKGGQVFNSLQERRCSNTAPVSVLFRKICI